MVEKYQNEISLLFSDWIRSFLRQKYKKKAEMKIFLEPQRNSQIYIFVFYDKQKNMCAKQISNFFFIWF